MSEHITANMVTDKKWNKQASKQTTANGINQQKNKQN
jgi:hypothetical protein